VLASVTDARYIGLGEKQRTTPVRIKGDLWWFANKFYRAADTRLTSADILALALVASYGGAESAMYWTGAPKFLPRGPSCS
jgi:hypothetical protein